MYYIRNNVVPLAALRATPLAITEYRGIDDCPGKRIVPLASLRATPLDIAKQAERVYGMPGAMEICT